VALHWEQANPAIEYDTVALRIEGAEAGDPPLTTVEHPE
jgi:hypothetical protein